MFRNRRGLSQDRFRRAWSASAQVGSAITAPPLNPGSNTYELVTGYGLVLDGHLFDFQRFHYWMELYRAIARVVTLMTAAQMGKSSWTLADMIFNALGETWGSNMGAYYPDKHLPIAFSRDRFAPMLEANPLIGRLAGAPRVAGGKRVAQGVFHRTLGPSNLYFLTIAGRSSTEGIPMRWLMFDELRRMQGSDVQRAEERASAQIDPIFRYTSTALMPNSDIHAKFLDGDQNFYYSDCRCPDGVVLAEHWPDCIADLTRATPLLRAQAEHAFHLAGRPLGNLTDAERKRYPLCAYICPTCGEWITNPQIGWWAPRNENAFGRSYHLPQLISPLWAAGRVWAAYTRNNVDIAEFYRSKLGLPHLDEQGAPVKWRHILQAVNESLTWPARESAEWRKKHLRDCAMGIDVQDGYLVVVIKTRGPNGKYRIVHLAILHGENPWKEAIKMFLEYNCRACVVDSQPAWDEAQRFARVLKGKVWLCIYVEKASSGQTVAWGDVGKQPRQKGETRFLYTVNVMHVRAFQWSLGLWTKGHCEIPPLHGLLQSLPTQNNSPVFSRDLRVGNWEPVPVANTFGLHLTRVAFWREYPKEDEEKQELGQYVLRRRHVGLDPHFAHANLYADLALSRIGALAPPANAPQDGLEDEDEDEDGGGAW